MLEWFALKEELIIFFLSLNYWRLNGMNINQSHKIRSQKNRCQRFHFFTTKNALHMTQIRLIMTQQKRGVIPDRGH